MRHTHTRLVSFTSFNVSLGTTEEKEEEGGDIVMDMRQLVHVSPYHSEREQRGVNFVHIVESVSTCNRAPDILGRCKVIRLPRPVPPKHDWCTRQWSELRFPLDLQNPTPRLQTAETGRERETEGHSY